MIWIIAAAFLILFWVIQVLTSKRMKFWKYVDRYPDAAFSFMMLNSETFAIKGVEDELDRSIYSTGPFFFFYISKHAVYANPKTLIAKQAEFVEMCKRHND